MAENTAVNSQITDAVTQANVQVLGDSPAIAMGNLYQATAQALSLAMLNATNAQQQNNMSAQASTTMGITTLYSIDVASSAKSASNIIDMVQNIEISDATASGSPSVSDTSTPPDETETPSVSDAPNPPDETETPAAD